MENEHDEVAHRRAKLAALRSRGDAFPNDFRRTALAAQLHARFDAMDAAAVEAEAVAVAVAGRLMSKRVMGRASFAHVQDGSGRIQLFVQRDRLPEGVYENEFRHAWDVGDIVGAEGRLFKTQTGELSVRAERIRLLAKALRPLPEKYHGLADREARYRRRYLDLIMNRDVRRTFERRSALIQRLRVFLTERGFLEVETPMMQPIPGGAAARPFKTYHNALDMELYLRVAPELYLKRLVVGGLERVFEINRNFRNEGVSARHNPEFTMLEFYQAYADYRDLMKLTEEMLRDLAEHLLGTARITYRGETYELGRPFARMTLKEAVLRFNEGLAPRDLEDAAALRRFAQARRIPVPAGCGAGRLQFEIFEKTVEARLREPTFVTEYPVEISPLARRSSKDPSVTERFELIVAGAEIANGFSELNDPEEQAERFRRQLQEKEAGEEEAMHFDADYIRALEHGMPPTAGEGIGIDRLVMLFTDSPSIRDVLLFPHMRPQA